MAITNQLFLKSWIDFNCDYYPSMAQVILKEFTNTSDNKLRKFLAVEIFKLVSEEIETIAMWFYSLEKCAVDSNLKIYEIYLNEFVKTDKFEKLASNINKLSPKEFREKYGIKEHIELDEIPGRTDELIKEIIKLTYELVHYGKVGHSQDLLKIYNKSKHGLVIYSDDTTPDTSLEFLIGKTDTGLIDTPFFEASNELVEIMFNSITKMCTPLLLSIIRLKYYSEIN
jgi:hypothetical protein